MERELTLLTMQRMLKLPSLPEPIAIDSIVCVEAAINYVWIYYLQDQTHQKYFSAKTLKWVEVQLVGFIRIHQSILINPTHIAKTIHMGSQRMVIQMTNGMALPVSRRRVESVCQQLDAYILLT